MVEAYRMTSVAKPHNSWRKESSIKCLYFPSYCLHSSTYIKGLKGDYKLHLIQFVILQCFNNSATSHFIETLHHYSSLSIFAVYITPPTRGIKAAFYCREQIERRFPILRCYIRRWKRFCKAIKIKMKCRMWITLLYSLYEFEAKWGFQYW